MHLLRVDTHDLDDGGAAVDLAAELGHGPGTIVVLSFTDSDLAGVAAAHAREPGLPPVSAAPLRRLRHPMSVDLYAERVVAGARFVLVRLLGGLDYWRYGVERLSSLCRANGVPLALVSGDDRPDPRLATHATADPGLTVALDTDFRAGGIDNLARGLRRIAAALEGRTEDGPSVPLPPAFAWGPTGALDLNAALTGLPDGPLVHILAYRSAILADDAAPLAALADALRARGLVPLVLAVTSLKGPEAAEWVRTAIARRRPDLILATTAFSARDDGGFVLDSARCPVLQALVCGTAREAWERSSRGLAAADLAMGVALPEFDGRLAAFPIAHKQEVPGGGRRQVPHPEGIAATADRAQAWIRLARTPREERRLALVLSDYPARGGRAGYAVGLDAPASVTAILDHLAAEGFSAAPAPSDLMVRLTEGAADLVVPLAAYRAWLDALPDAPRAALLARWGKPKDDPALRDGAYRFRAVRAGRVTMALQPDRGAGAGAAERKAGYHDPDAPPGHAYLAFYLALRDGSDAIVHLGTHGTTEWLPGKAVALSAACWPALVAGPLPVIYPFIVDDPGEAAPAKRRLGAVTIGHLTPAVAAAGLDGEAAALRELVEEYAAAAVLDPRRADLVARDVLERARAAQLDAVVPEGASMEEALTALDAQLCDLAEVPIRDGLHVFGVSGDAASADNERRNLVRALDGRFVEPGPAGSPSRGRRDVLPTGRNLATLDPRAIPTRAAAHLAERAAAEVLRRHLQECGEYPRRIVMDLWASPTLRTGGEDVAHALLLMGVRPLWDTASTRVSGFAVEPLALLGRPRIDVTTRVSGAFRDTFPDALALLDRAARAVAMLDEEDADNPLAEARRRGESAARVFGPAPGRYGAGAARLALDGDWTHRDDLGHAYLAATSHAFGRDDGTADPGFARRVARADALVHAFDVGERDLLDGDAAAESLGGFAAAAALVGGTPALYGLDTARDDGPRARTAREEAARLLRGRLANPRWIEGQLRHGWSGAAELAQAVDATFVLAATTDAVAGPDLDRLYDALVGDLARHERIEAANPAAAQAIRARFAEMARRGIWHSRRNSPLAAAAE